MHLRQAEVIEKTNSSGPFRVTAPGSYVPAARLRAELGSFVRLIWISLLFEGVPANLVRGLLTARDANRNLGTESQPSPIGFRGWRASRRSQVQSSLAVAQSTFAETRAWDH